MAKDKAKQQTDAEKPGTSKSTAKATADNDGIWQDSRFQHLLSDPRFKHLPKAQRKVKIDKRFQSMFTDNKFKVKYTVDKYGRRVNQSNAEDLKKYYELNSDEEDESASNVAETTEVPKSDASDVEDVEAEQREEEKAISRDVEDQNDALVSDGEDVPTSLRQRLFDPQIDYARGEGRLITDSSSDDESSEEEDEQDDNIEHTWGELDAEAERTDESTNRLAVCNMDWDRIRAVDLMMLFSSFLPPGGSVLNVKIYPSQFGKERLKAEEQHGPAELVGLGKEVRSEDSNDSADESDDDVVKEQDSDAEEGDEYHMEKLRQYQLNRLRYYYAVVECDSVTTADKIYSECDGLEYESSATRIDLRFIPDDTSFDEDEPTDVCTELPAANSYQPREFTNTALQQAKVDLTWDETAVERRELSDKLASGKLDAVNDKDLRQILAYSSEEDESHSDVEKCEENNKDSTQMAQATATAAADKPNKPKKDDYISKYKALLAEINEKEEQEKNKKFEMQITWDINEDDEADKRENKDITPANKPNSALTPIEKVLLKRSEKNKQRKLDRKKKKLQSQGLGSDASENDSDSDTLPNGIDMNDPYFAEEFANGQFEDPKAKKREKKKKQRAIEVEDEAEVERQAKELELLLDDDDEKQQGKQHFSLDKILKSEKETKSKRKRRKQLKKSKTEIAARSKEIEDSFQLDLDDNRFKAIYTSPHFNIDPTHSHFKKTKNMDRIIHEKLKRRHGDGLNGKTEERSVKKEEVEPELKRPKKQIEQSLLVKSLKRKLQAQH